MSVHPLYLPLDDLKVTQACAVSAVEKQQGGKWGGGEDKDLRRAGAAAAGTVAASRGGCGSCREVAPQRSCC